MGVDPVSGHLFMVCCPVSAEPGGERLAGGFMALFGWLLGWLGRGPVGRPADAFEEWSAWPCCAGFYS